MPYFEKMATAGKQLYIKKVIRVKARFAFFDTESTRRLRCPVIVGGRKDIDVVVVILRQIGMVAGTVATGGIAQSVVAKEGTIQIPVEYTDPHAVRISRCRARCTARIYRRSGADTREEFIPYFEYAGEVGCLAVAGKIAGGNHFFGYGLCLYIQQVKRKSGRIVRSRDGNRRSDIIVEIAVGGVSRRHLISVKPFLQLAVRAQFISGYLRGVSLPVNQVVGVLRTVKYPCGRCFRFYPVADNGYLPGTDVVCLQNIRAVFARRHDHILKRLCYHRRLRNRRFIITR
ncbi:hypothetical protein Barb7_03227 [Bacteroidales bacterium Barb7]|nr:hypothetical protein Barb7_03227 [Bacteroidales bacterium Barb7]